MDTDVTGPGGMVAFGGHGMFGAVATYKSAGAPSPKPDMFQDRRPCDSRLRCWILDLPETRPTNRAFRNVKRMHEHEVSAVALHPRGAALHSAMPAGCLEKGTTELSHSSYASKPRVQTRVSRKSAIVESVVKNVLRDADGERRPSVSDGLADELTLRREEAGVLRTFVDTTNVGDSGWEPPLVRPLTQASRDRNGRSGTVCSWR